jgi:hypothetical protein
MAEGDDPCDRLVHTSSDRNPAMARYRFDSDGRHLVGHFYTRPLLAADPRGLGAWRALSA